MENKPITSLSWQDELIYAHGTKLIESTNVMTFESQIKGVRSYNNKLVVFTKRTVSLLSKREKIELIWTKTLNTDIIDVYLYTKICILMSNGIYIRIKNLSLNEIDRSKIFNKTIFSGHITENKVLIGTFDDIHIFDVEQDEFPKEKSVLRYHRGRVFDITLTENNLLFSCAEDRKICLNGTTIIQDYRNYYYKLYYNGLKLYAFNKNGHLNIFENNNVVLKKNFGNNSLTSIFEKFNRIYIGTKTGSIYEVINNEIKQIRGPHSNMIGYNQLYSIKGVTKLFNCGAYFYNNQIIYNKLELTTSECPIDCFAYENDIFLLRHDCVEMYNFISDDCNSRLILKFNNSKIQFSNISAHNNKLFLYNTHIYIIVCLLCFRIIQITRCEKILAIKSGIVCAKNGCIAYKSSLYKISNSQITDVIIHKHNIFAIDSNGKFLTINMDSISTTDTNILERKDLLKNHACIYNNSSVSVDYFQQKLAILDFSDISIKNIILNRTNLIDLRPRVLYKYAGNANNGLCIIKNEVFSLNKSKDIATTSTMLLERHGDSLTCYEIDVKPDISVAYCDFTAKISIQNYSLVGNEHGCLFLIISTKMIDFIRLLGSIVDIFDVKDASKNIYQFFVYTRPGRVYVIRIYNERLFIIKEAVFSHKVTAAFKDQVCLSDGRILKLDINLTCHVAATVDSYVTAMIDKMVSFNGYVQHIESKTSKKISNLSIFKIKCFRNLYVAVSDDHSVIIFNKDLKVLNTAVPHSAQIFDVCIFGMFIITVSSDMRICILDEKLNTIQYLYHNVKLPKIVIVLNNSKLMVLGESIEEIDFKLIEIAFGNHKISLLN
ncbi:uncharacterized protein VICG_00778 [Vittaforma corneae ATCC 50505]|uniref:Uncharacterized protein n=1 Tax=Vittaforma corneae (strain ATCC 50505) TaxID=993615 RepID=L2GPB3_VITCO|nr:uncharacterized protein VICG_00778 [Vittaforma corneae ATCC 50505]ELA42137.1 hypothetical protein VICG_00778 [Vittaforma corneae ATCC 50505]